MKLKSLLFFLLTALCFAVPSYAQQDNSFAQKIARDLVGQVVTDPPQTYFPEEWKWTLDKGEIESVDIKKTKKDSKNYNAAIIAHLKRGLLKIDAKIFVKYQYDGKKWVLTKTEMKSLTIPKQKDYSHQVELFMDYDFLPALMLKNNGDKTLFVRVEAVSNGEKEYFSTIVEPYKETMVAMGAVQSYKVLYAYKK